MANYQEARVKLTNAHINKLKSSGKNNAGTTLRTTEKNILVDELPHKLFLAITTTATTEQECLC